MPRLKVLKHKEIGKTIRKWMIDADLSVTDMADRLGLRRSTFYYKIKNGSFTYEDLLNVIEICNPPDDEIVRTMRR